MRAHTITTKARLGASARKRGTIFALSLAVALFAATASTASTTPTPPAPPLTLDVLVKNDLLPTPPRWTNPSFGDGCCYSLKKKLKLRATTSNDTTLVARGDVKKTTKQLAAGEETEFTVRLKQSKWKQLTEEEDAPKPVRLKAKIKVKATDEFGQTATDRIKVTDMRNPQFPQCKVFCTGDL